MDISRGRSIAWPLCADAVILLYCTYCTYCLFHGTLSQSRHSMSILGAREQMQWRAKAAHSITLPPPALWPPRYFSGRHGLLPTENTAGGRTHLIRGSFLFGNWGSIRVHGLPPQRRLISRSGPREGSGARHMHCGRCPERPTGMAGCAWIRFSMSACGRNSNAASEAGTRGRYPAMIFFALPLSPSIPPEDLKGIRVSPTQSPCSAGASMGHAAPGHS